MRAAVLSALGGPLTIEDIPTPAPQAGEVLVRVAACGVCHTDLHVIKGEVQFPLPCVLGHEISGVVEAVAAGGQTPQPGDAGGRSVARPAALGHTRVRGRADPPATFPARDTVDPN